MRAADKKNRNQRGYKGSAHWHGTPTREVTKQRQLNYIGGSCEARFGAACLCAKFNNDAHWIRLSKTRVFEKAVTMRCSLDIQDADLPVDGTREPAQGSGLAY
jgi:hypothetical protein